MNIFDHVSAVQPAIEEFILHERETWGAYYKIIEDYVSEKKLILGGNTAVKLFLSGGKRTLDDFKYVIYVPYDFTYEFAIELTNKLNDGPDGRMSSMKTILPHSKFVISVDFRPLVVMYKVHNPNADRLKVIDIIRPETRQWFSGRDVLVLPADLLMFELCHTLTNPADYDDWDDARVSLNALMKYPISGGNEKQNHTFARDVVQQEIMQKYVTNNDSCCVIGFHALAVLSGKPLSGPSDRHILHLITGNNQRTIIEKIIKDLVGNKGDVTHIKRDMYIPTDNRIKRTQIRLDGRDIAYLYNSAAYDLIPTIKRKGVRFGTPLVIMRFFILEIWIIRTIIALSAANKEFAEMRKNEFLTAVLRAYKCFDKMPEISADDYIGVYENEELAFKMKSLVSGKFFGDYVPAVVKARSGEYTQPKNEDFMKLTAAMAVVADN